MKWVLLGAAALLSGFVFLRVAAAVFLGAVSGGLAWHGINFGVFQGCLGFLIVGLAAFLLASRPGAKGRVARAQAPR